MRWSIDVLVGEQAVASLGSVPQLLGMAPFTGISVGFDYGGPVDWDVHQRHGIYRYRGQLDWVRYVPGEKASYNSEIIVAIDELTQRVLE